MKALDQKAISSLITKNYINRNTQLATFIRLINSLQGSQILAVDGAWGSGKTVFVKQLDLLCEGDDVPVNIPNIDQQDIQKLQNTYTSIYYNAWENDYFDDALQSILYNLVAKIDKTHGGLQENSQKKAISKIDIAGLVKNISHDVIDLNGKTSNEKLTAEIQGFVDRKEKIVKSLQKLIEKTDKRILFIIDELDRCSPSFAVKILETIKHYFEIDNITFVLAVNTDQLAHTVKKFYGSGFDGYGYLNKFFDFPFSLQDPDVKKFAQEYLGKNVTRDIVTKVPIEVATSLDMKMREIESYYKSLGLIESYLFQNIFREDGNYQPLAQCVYVPFALALKIKNGDDYRVFITGGGENQLKKFLLSASDTQEYIGQFCHDKALTTPGANEETASRIIVDFAVVKYKAMFGREKNREIKYAKDAFMEAVSVISRYTDIKESSAEVKE